MNTTSSPLITSRRLTYLGATLAAVVTLSACSSVGYRCPLDPKEQAKSPTACVSMQDAMKGAVNGTGGKTSVILDDQGRIVPVERSIRNPAEHMRVAAPAQPGVKPGPSGQPVYQNPQVYQVWSSSFEDSNGHFHDGQHSWFATKGKWTQGSADSPNSVGRNIMRPTFPDDKPKGTILPTDRHGNPITMPAQQAPVQYQPVTQPDKDMVQGAIGNLANGLEGVQREAALETTSGVTAPTVRLGK